MKTAEAFPRFRCAFCFSISVNVWTDSVQSEIAAKMFSLRLPGLDRLRREVLKLRAVAATVIVHRMLSTVCGEHDCSALVSLGWGMPRHALKFVNCTHCACVPLYVHVQVLVYSSLPTASVQGNWFSDIIGCTRVTCTQ